MKRLFVSILLCTTTICVIMAQESQLKLGVTQGHPNGGDIEEVSPDKKYLLTTSWVDGSAKLWDIVSGKLLYTVEGIFRESKNQKDTKGCIFSKDGKLISCYSCNDNEGITTVWETKTGKPINTFKGCDPKFVDNEILLVGRLLYNVNRQAQLRSFEETPKGLSPNENQIAFDIYKTGCSIYNIVTGDTLLIKDQNQHFGKFSDDGKYFSTYEYTESTKVHRIYYCNSGKIVNKFIAGGEPLFLPTDKYFCSDGSTVKIWEINSGKQLVEFEKNGNNDGIVTSPCGKFILIENELIEIQTGKRKPIFGRPYSAFYRFSANCQFAYQFTDSLKIYDLNANKELTPLSLGRWSSDILLFTDTGQEKVILSNDLALYNLNTKTFLWSVNSSKVDTQEVFWGESTDDLYLLGGFSAEQKMVSPNRGNIFRIEGSTGKIVKGTNDEIMELSKNGKIFLSAKTLEAYYGANIIIGGRTLNDNELYWQVYLNNTSDSSAVLVKVLFSDYETDQWIRYGKPPFFSPNGKYFVIEDSIFSTASKKSISQGNFNWNTIKQHLSDDWEYYFSSNGESLKIVKTEDGSPIYTINEPNSGCVIFSTHELIILRSAKRYKLRVYNLKTKEFLFEFEPEEEEEEHLRGDGGIRTKVAEEILYSNEGKYMATHSNQYDVEVWDMNGKRVSHLAHTPNKILLVKFSPGGEKIITITNDQKINIWNVTSGQLIRSITTSDGTFLNFSRDKKLAVTSNGANLTIIDTESWEIKLTKTMLNEDEWVITHPSGLFDASPAAMSSLYFVQGLDIIEFNQLKERYYEPGLWKKVMTGEKLRNVVGMKSIELPPDIRVGQVDAKGYLPIELINKGGGIGEVTILINGKEAIADARPKGSNSKSDKLSLKAYIGNNKALIKGSDNFIAVKAWNEGHWVVSRGAGITYVIEGNEKAYKPAIHIITSGVSDYTGTELDLKYAAKDAEDVSKALQLGAKKLFGTDRSYVYNLTTSQPTNQYPTKANILKTFEKVSSVAHPLDLVVVYLSGHGINHGGQDGDWYYLTQDAYTSSSSAYNDPEIRRTSTVSSNELVELFKKVPALKQVLMIDACASGKVVENLMAKKDIESTTLRALDRMRDRTGLHIITGCTADAVSYEASKYGQGVLTYSLLEGIRGAALREDQFVDINKLFQYAHDRVPTLAEGIGGIQTPQVFSPQGGQSFDIGQLTDQEKKDIPIAKIRPVYIRSTFQDSDQFEDALQLGKKIDEALSEAASKGTGSSLIFVDVREYPEGCKLSGLYKQEGGIIKLKLRKKCEGKDETLEINGKTVEEVKNKIISSL